MRRSEHCAWLGALLAVLVFSFTVRADRRTKALETHELRIIGGDGTVRARLMADKGTVMLELLDPDGVRRIELSADEHGATALRFYRRDLEFPATFIEHPATETALRAAVFGIVGKGNETRFLVTASSKDGADLTLASGNHGLLRASVGRAGAAWGGGSAIWLYPDSGDSSPGAAITADEAGAQAAFWNNDEIHRVPPE